MVKGKKRGRKKKVLEVPRIPVVPIIPANWEITTTETGAKIADDLVMGAEPAMPAEPEAQIEKVPDSMPQVEKHKRHVWVRIIFPSGERHKVPAELVAEHYIENCGEKTLSDDELYEKIITDSTMLTDWLQHKMSWDIVFDKAIRYMPTMDSAFETQWDYCMFTCSRDGDPDD